MTNFDYLCTISLDKFTYFLCGLMGNMSEQSIQIMKSWLEKEVDDEFFSDKVKKEEYLKMFEQYQKEFDEFRRSKHDDSLDDWYSFLLELYKKSLS